MEEKKQSMSRRHERELALRAIFQIPFHQTEEELQECIQHFLEDQSEYDGEESIQGEPTGFAARLIEATLDNLEAIDERIETYLRTDWKLERIPNAEKAILRLSVAEMLYVGTAHEIAINEAIELAKSYGDEDGRRYVNGILNHLAQDYLKDDEA
jgi:N utilization substance protein B